MSTRSGGRGVYRPWIVGLAAVTGFGIAGCGGKASPVIKVSATMNTMAGRISLNMTQSPQARCKAVSTRSMALMPMNGTMMPPMP